MRQVPKGEVDRTLIGKLREEAPGILAWAVEGAQQWYEHGLPRPDDVTAALDSWREECDNVENFLDERCEQNQRFSLGASRLYVAYKIWGESRKEEPLTSTAFGNQLTQRFSKEHTNRGSVYRGFRPIAPVEETTESDGQ